MNRRKSLRRRSHGFRNAVIIVVFSFAALATIFYVGLNMGINSDTVTVKTGSQAPDFSLNSVAGVPFKLSDQTKNNSVLLFFNEGLSCSPCLQQMVDIDRDYSRFRDMGVMVVSITTNSMGDMQAWAGNNGIANMPVLVDETLSVDREYQTLYAGSMHAGMAPGHTFILVGEDGTISWRKDYGAYTMYVPMSELMSSVKSALG